MAKETISLKEQSDIRQNRWRSFVRIFVTYAFTFTYLLSVYLLIQHFLALKTPGGTTNALALFSGLSTAAMGVIGFWFGGRNIDKIQEQLKSPNTTGASDKPNNTIQSTTTSQQTNDADKINKTQPASSMPSSQASAS